MERKTIIASLEYSHVSKIADKDIKVNDIVAIERHDGNSIAIKFINGYTAFVPAAIGMKIQQLWHTTADEVVPIGAEKKPE